MKRLLMLVLSAVFMVACSGNTNQKVDGPVAEQRKSCTKKKCKKENMVYGKGWLFKAPAGWTAEKSNDKKNKFLQMTAETDKSSAVKAFGSFLMLPCDKDLVTLTKVATSDLADKEGFVLVAVEPVLYKDSRSGMVLFRYPDLLGMQLTMVRGKTGYILRCIGDDKKETVDKCVAYLEGFEFSKANSASADH